MAVRSTSLLIIYLRLLVDLVPLTLLEGDFLGTDGGRGNVGLAGGNTLATSSFNLLDCKLFRGTLCITYELDTAFKVDGWNSGISNEVALLGVMLLLGDRGLFSRFAAGESVVVSGSFFRLGC